MYLLLFIEILIVVFVELKFIFLRVNLVCLLVGLIMGDIYNLMKYIIGVIYISIWFFYLLINNLLDIKYGLKFVYFLLEMRIYRY